MNKVTKLPADNLISCFAGSNKDCVKVLDSDANILSVNEHGLKIMEIDDIKSVIGTKWLSLWTGEMEPKAKAAFAKVLEGELGYFEGFCPTLKGTPKWWEVTIVPLMNDHKEIDWILSMSRDVTELHNLREENKNIKSKPPSYSKIKKESLL